MSTHADKTQENKSQSISNGESKMHSNGESTFQFVDNRSEATAQRKLQDMANESPHVSQLRALQYMANNSKNAQQAVQLLATSNNNSAQQQEPIQKKENNTVLPVNLKSGMENLAGMSLDDVKVHRNSDKPAQLQAHAYTQGTDIHLGPGQEKHLAHETWHLVQQKQGRVKPTAQMKAKVNVNDEAGLEKKADVMGAKALQGNANPIKKPNLISKNNDVFQRMVINLDPSDDIISSSVPNVAKRKFSDDTFPQKDEVEVFENEMREKVDNLEKVHDLIMNTASADFSGLENSVEPVIFVGHGIYTGEFDSALGGFGRIMKLFRPQLGFQYKFWKSYSGKKLGQFLIKKGLPKNYKGQIYADGCNTATGPELGAPKAFIDDLSDFLQSKGYDYVSVKGNLGWANTQEDGKESSESPMVKTAIQNAVDALHKLEPSVKIEKAKNEKYDGFKWMQAHGLHELETELEQLKSGGGNQEEIEKVKTNIVGYKTAVAGHGFKPSGWTPKHAVLYKDFAENNKSKEIVEFVRVRAPKKLPRK
jgi:hypothetical protein